jgi:hypothetical protein
MSCISERFNLVLYRSAWLTDKAIETAFVTLYRYPGAIAEYPAIF